MKPGKIQTNFRCNFMLFAISFFVGCPDLTIAEDTSSSESPKRQTSQNRNSSPTNVILFIADDVSWNDFGCYGNRFARTPNINRLSRDGIRFNNAYLTASSCSPSRASIVTGRYPHNTGKAAELHLPIARHLTWFPQVLRQSGYHTGLVGKNHMTRAKASAGIGKDSEVTAPWDLVRSGNEKGNRGGHATWVQTVAERPRDKPFFFWFASLDAHRGWDADPDWKPEYGPMHKPENVIVPPFLVDDLPTRKDLASYYNEVTRYDYFIGKVIAELERQGELDSTLILVMADNGRPFPRAKTRLHDSGMKTALVAHWPDGIKTPGQVSNGLVSAIDIAPTILKVCGTKIPESIQGVDFCKAFEDPKAKLRQFAFSEHNWHDYEAHGRSVRDDRGYLFIRNFRPQLAWQGPADSVRSPSHRSLLKKRDEKSLDDKQADVFTAPRSPAELFQTSNDPHQVNNLVGKADVAQIETQLRQILDRWMTETKDDVPDQISEDSFHRETGESLGKKDYRKTTPGEKSKSEFSNHPGPR